MENEQNEYTSFPREHMLRICVDLLTEILATVQAESDTLTLTIAEMSGQDQQIALRVLHAQKSANRQRLLKELWQRYGPDFGSQILAGNKDE